MNIGDIYGKWTVLERVNNVLWRCRCECGQERTIQAWFFEKGTRQSCIKCFQSVKFRKWAADKYKEMVGKTFGCLTIQKVYNEQDGKRRRWMCDCLCRCGKISHKRLGQLLGRYKFRYCIYCRSVPYEIITGPSHKGWKGYGEISGAFWAKVRNGAKNRGLRITISPEYAWGLFEKQNRTCALSGLQLRFEFSHRVTETTASLDRIDSTKGYVNGNVQWVHKRINIMKQAMSDSAFIEMCTHVTVFSKMKAGGSWADLK